MKESLGLFLIFGIGFVLGLILSPATAGAWNRDFLSSFLPQFVATIAGVLAGAWISVYAESKRAERQEHQRRAAAANNALFTIGRMCAAYTGLCHRIVDPVRNHPVRWYAMTPTGIVLNDKMHFEFENLQFLIQSKDPNVLLQLDMWEHRYHSLVAILERQSRMHIEELQPRVEAAGLQGAVDHRLIEKAAGPRIKGTLIGFTDHIIQSADEGVRDLPALLEKIFTAAAPMVGREKLVKLSIDTEKTVGSKPKS